MWPQTICKGCHIQNLHKFFTQIHQRQRLYLIYLIGLNPNWNELNFDLQAKIDFFLQCLGHFASLYLLKWYLIKIAVASSPLKLCFNLDHFSIFHFLLEVRQFIKFAHHFFTVQPIKFAPWHITYFHLLYSIFEDHKISIACLIPDFLN